MNFFPATVLRTDEGAIAFDMGDGVRLALPTPCEGYLPYVGKEVEIGIRPEHLSIDRSDRREQQGFPVEVEVVEPMGAQSLVVFDLAGTEGSALCDPQDAPHYGQTVTFYANMDKLHVIDVATGRVVPRGTPVSAATETAPAMTMAGTA
jgi:multiple sugar transport system ATP-binding protein